MTITHVYGVQTPGFHPQVPQTESGATAQPVEMLA